MIDFEGLAEGSLVASVSDGSGMSGGDGHGAIGVDGSRTTFTTNTAPNHAMIFDATCALALNPLSPLHGCSGGGGAVDDDDLWMPDSGNILIITQDDDGTNPDDNGGQNGPTGGIFSFDFSAFAPGSVTVDGISHIDLGEGGTIRVYSDLFSTLIGAPIAIPPTGNNVFAMTAVNRAGVVSMEIQLNGSGAIDDLRLGFHHPSGQGCTPGLWKNHLDPWTTYEPGHERRDLRGTRCPRRWSADAAASAAKWRRRRGRAGRHAVAALLNAAFGEVDYAFSTGEIIAMVRAAYAGGTFEATKNLLAAENERGCSVMGQGPATGQGGGPQGPGAQGEAKGRNK